MDTILRNSYALQEVGVEISHMEYDPKILKWNKE
jgi:hypothetical protein